MKKIIGLAIIFIFTGTAVYVESEFIPGRSQHSAIYDSVNKQIIVFGGTFDGTFSDTWAFDTEKKEWKEIETDETPPARYAHSAIYDPVNKQMIIFGGYDGHRNFSDLWAFDIEKKAWKEIITDGNPPARNYHSAIYDSVNEQMIIFGGDNNMGCLSDSWVFDIAKKAWKEIETKETPPARYTHSAIYDPVNKQMIIFGGTTPIKTAQGTTHLMPCDTWTLDLQKRKTWEEIKCKVDTRHESTAVYDFANKRMIICGGGGFQTFGLWAFDIENKKWKEIKVK